MFNTARESYTPIISPPTDNDMVQLRNARLTILYSIFLGADTACPSGLILADAAYKRSLGTTVNFDPMIGAFKLYDPSIEDDATALYRLALIQPIGSSLVVTHRKADVQVTSDRPFTLGLFPVELSTSISGIHAPTYVVNAYVY